MPRPLKRAFRRAGKAWLEQARTARSPRDIDYAAAKHAYDEAAQAAIDAATPPQEEI